MTRARAARSRDEKPRRLATLAALLAAVAAGSECIAPLAATPAAAAQEAPHAPRPAPRDDAADEADEPGRLIVTGDDDGYLDACGCDDGQLGGLPRRVTVVKTLRGADDDASLLVSNGRVVKGAAELDEWRLETIFQAMAQMGYAAVAVSEKELAFGRAKLAELGKLLGGGALLGTSLVDARAPDSAAPPLPVKRALERVVRGKRWLALSAVSTARAAAFAAVDRETTLADPAAAIAQERAAHPRAEVTVVLAQMELAEAQALARAVPGLDAIVIAGDPGDDEPAERPIAEGKTWIVTTGRRGRYVVAVDLGGRRAHAREPVRDVLDKSADVQDLIDLTYRDRLEAERVVERFYAQRPTASGAAYAGAQAGSCGSCHPQAWKTWEESRHAHAWETLVKQDEPPPAELKKGHQRHAIWDPDCVRCHVTGFGEVSGFAGIERDDPQASLRGVGCEACHGPAGDHAERAEKGDTKWPGGPIAKAGTPELEALCRRCHDADNSTRFALTRDERVPKRTDYWNGLFGGEQRPPIAHGRE